MEEEEEEEEKPEIEENINGEKRNPSNLDPEAI